MAPKGQAQCAQAKDKAERRKIRLHRLKHNNSQRKYREKNKDAVKERAKMQMREYRARVKNNEESKKAAADKRREADADYRERQRQKKYIAKFGEQAFQDLYAPLYRIHGNQLAKQRLKFEWDDENGEAEREEIMDLGAEAAILLTKGGLKTLE
ncbi:hypothetical protein C8R43DRAFT_1120395 [Mycena crocata]|nr:hypothetical protein C8R43DRAFT_1120395 [Mycena crocata]